MCTKCDNKPSSRPHSDCDDVKPLDWTKPLVYRRLAADHDVPCRVICTDAKGDSPYVVLIDDGTKEYSYQVSPSGSLAGYQRVFNAPVKKTKTIYLARNKSTGFIFTTESSDYISSSRCTHLGVLTFEWEE